MYRFPLNIEELAWYLLWDINRDLNTDSDITLHVDNPWNSQVSTIATVGVKTVSDTFFVVFKLINNSRKVLKDKVYETMVQR